MTKIARALLGSALLSLLCSGCVPLQGNRMIPDQRIPHRMAQPAVLQLWIRRPDGKLEATEYYVPEGWWVASPTVVEGK